jgi:hypothetical protein
VAGEYGIAMSKDEIRRLLQEDLSDVENEQDEDANPDDFDDNYRALSGFRNKKTKVC